ncbi:preprotein translocase subunit SecE [Legionella sp. W05-934-2]|jgi:preprotein translocase subunit SecE|uniref:preprotein translocase subunit SecE n=1 Tax=Legionella sp. W05-934-2 TaxID=1198649 RepID=UPI0034623047
MKKITRDKQENKLQDILVMSIFALLTFAATYITYHYSIAGPIKALIWIGWFIISLAILYLSSYGKSVWHFTKQAKMELQKVVWPTRKETVQMTTIVVVMVTITGFILWIIDSGMMWLIGKITQLG